MYCNASIYAATLQPQDAIKAISGANWWLRQPPSCVSITFPGALREMQIVAMVWGKEKPKTLGCLQHCFVLMHFL